MGRFLDPLQLEATDETRSGRPVYRLLRDFRYEYGAPWSGHAVTVPRDFETDLASVPRLFWRVVPPSLGQKAAVVHDYLYRTGELPRRVADAVFRHALADAGVDAFRRWWMWLAVRCGGRKAYKGDVKR